MSERLSLSDYQTFLFDCDGVILDSNSVKSDAFYELACPFGEDVAREFVRYHKSLGGVSRFEKVRHFVNVMLGEVGNETMVTDLVSKFGDIVSQRLAECKECPGIRDLLRLVQKSGANAHVVSGGLQSELEFVLSKKGLAPFFSTINGSPRTKNQILSDLIKSGAVARPAIFFGDSRQDHLAAEVASVAFVFVSGFTEMYDWQDYTAANALPVCASLQELL